jgi:hypothetical protein
MPQLAYNRLLCGCRSVDCIMGTCYVSHTTATAQRRILLSIHASAALVPLLLSPYHRLLLFHAFWRWYWKWFESYALLTSVFIQVKMMNVGSTMYLSPSSIRFSQDSIGRKFTCGTAITEMFRQVVTGEKSVNDIERISVFRDRNLYWIYRGNRRLYVFKKLEMHGFIKSILVKAVPSPFEINNEEVCMIQSLTKVNIDAGAFLVRFISSYRRFNRPRTCHIMLKRQLLGL